MKSELVHGNILVKRSPVHGYGVFANQNFDTGEIIEECYVLLFTDEIHQLSNYVFSLENRIGVPLGNGMIYNHFDFPNMSHKYDAERSVLIFQALRPIKKGEELFHSYGEDWFSTRNMRVKHPSLRFKFRQLRPLFKLLLRFAIIAIALSGLRLIMNGVTQL